MYSKDRHSVSLLTSLHIRSEVPLVWEPAIRVPIEVLIIWFEVTISWLRQAREREREREERASYGGIGYHNLITLLSRLSCAVFRISIIAMLTDRWRIAHFWPIFSGYVTVISVSLGSNLLEVVRGCFSYVFSLTACAWIEDFDILFRAHVSVG